MVTAVKSNHRMAKKDAQPTRPPKDTPKAQMLEDRQLKDAVAQIEKQFGEGAIMPLGVDSGVRVQGIPTGSLSLDIALGGYGLPKGRIAEVFGPESSGKTTLALHVIAQAQKAGGIAAFIDAEHALDPSWGQKAGRRAGNVARQSARQR